MKDHVLQDTELHARGCLVHTLGFPNIWIKLSNLDLFFFSKLKNSLEFEKKQVITNLEFCT